VFVASFEVNHPVFEAEIVAANLLDFKRRIRFDTSNEIDLFDN
jgi:hypothetical protein